jgi:hypothetical protein
VSRICYGRLFIYKIAHDDTCNLDRTNHQSLEIGKFHWNYWFEWVEQINVFFKTSLLKYLSKMPMHLALPQKLTELWKKVYLCRQWRKREKFMPLICVNFKKRSMHSFFDFFMSTNVQKQLRSEKVKMRSLNFWSIWRGIYDIEEGRHFWTWTTNGQGFFHFMYIKEKVTKISKYVFKD